MRLSLMLPWPPSTNRYWRHVDGKALLSSEGRSYIKAVSKVAATARANGQLPQEPLQTRLAVLLHAFVPDTKARDLDNLLKASLDAMTVAGVYADDSQIDDLHVIRCERVRGGLLGVQIMEMEG